MPAGQRPPTVVAEVPDAELWWPRGYGEQPLYDCDVTLTAAGRPGTLDRWQRRIGFRTVELDTAPDEHGSAFTLVVNGTPVFARGVNWIPDDGCVTRVTPRATGAGSTRPPRPASTWSGSGAAASTRATDFYDVCDELGLLVWQDFLFACAAYPEEEPLRAEVEAEARENVVRLMPHPSLVLWNGNNENLWGFRDWDWEEALGRRSPGARATTSDLLPRIVAEIDPTRPYWPGSP